MARMADVIAQGRVMPAPWIVPKIHPEHAVAAAARARERIQTVPIFAVDNVCEYLFAETDQEEWLIGRDFPCLAPPFEEFWIEMRRPSSILSTRHDGKRLPTDQYPPMWGFFFCAHERDEAMQSLQAVEHDPARRAQVLEQLDRQTNYSCRLLAPEIDRKLKAGGGYDDLTKAERELVGQCRLYQDLKEGRWDRLAEQVARTESRLGDLKWVLDATLYLLTPEKDFVFGPYARWQIPVNADGTGVDDLVTYGCMAMEDAHPTEYMLDVCSMFIFPALLALTFMHCKNVNAVAAPAMPDRWLKRREKRGKAKPLAYQTLEIDPMRQAIRRSAGTAGAHGAGHARALRIMRGHFKDYKEGQGLFGKHHGLYWWEHRLKDSGPVTVDYKVKAKRQAA